MNNVIKDYEQDSNNSLYRNLRSMFTDNDIEDAMARYHVSKHNGFTFDEALLSQCNADHDLLAFMSATFKGEPDRERLIQSGIGMAELIFLVSKYKKSKQSYVFDKDFVAELSNTKAGITVPYNVFSRLPFQIMYLDFSANKEVTEKTGIDGVLVHVKGIDAQLGSSQKKYWLLQSASYKNGVMQYLQGQIVLDTPEGFTLAADDMTVEDTVLTPKQRGEFEAGLDTQATLLIQSLLYLSSYEPDIHESKASKARMQTAKRKKTAKADLPERVYQVGERFGEAFRKWTQGSLGQSHDGSGVGVRKRPHVRRAHWHRYWIGKKNSPERELTLKWVSECFCGLSEHEAEDKLDSVSHDVKGE